MDISHAGPCASRLSVRPASFFFSPSLAAQEISFQVPICASPVPVGEASEALDRVGDALAESDCSATSALQWRPRPERFAVRLGAADLTCNHAACAQFIDQ